MAEHTRLITAPLGYPVTVADMLADRQLDADAPQAERCEPLIKSITAAVENYLNGRKLCLQTWELILDDFPRGRTIRLPFAPIQEVVGVFYRDTDGVEQELDADWYEVDTKGGPQNTPHAEPGEIVLLPDYSWPSTNTGINNVRVQFDAGYTPSEESPANHGANVPEDIRDAILLWAGTRFEHREAVVAGVMLSELPRGLGLDALLWPYRLPDW